MLQKIFIKEHEDLIKGNGFTLEEFEDLPGNKQAEYIEFWKDKEKKQRRSEVYNNCEEASLKMLGNYLQDTERQKALKDYKNQLSKEVEDKKQGNLGEGKELLQRTRLEWNREKIMYFFKKEETKSEADSSEPQQRSIFDLRHAKKRVNKNDMLKALEEKQRMYSERFNKRTVFDYVDDKRISPENPNNTIGPETQNKPGTTKPKVDPMLLYGADGSDSASLGKRDSSSESEDDNNLFGAQASKNPQEMSEFDRMLAQGLASISNQVNHPAGGAKKVQTIAEDVKPIRPSKPEGVVATKKVIPRNVEPRKRLQKPKPTFQEVDDEDYEAKDKQSADSLDYSELSEKKADLKASGEKFKITKDDIQSQMHILKTMFDEDDDEEQFFSSGRKQRRDDSYGTDGRGNSHTEASQIAGRERFNSQTGQQNMQDVLGWLNEEEMYLDQVKQHRTLQMRHEEESLGGNGSGVNSPRSSQGEDSGMKAFFGGFNRDADDVSNSQQKFKPGYELKTGRGSKMQKLQEEFMDKKVPSLSELSSDPLEGLKGLLDLFGIPYVESPGEAEAQCAQLEIEGKVDGVITEDSDTFLFGSKKIIRGLFGSGGNPEEYSLDQIEIELGFSREQLIMLALFLGCDYTIGIHGVGIVNAVEIVDAYGTIEALGRFKQWAEKPDYWMDKTIYEESRRSHPKEYQYMLKHKNYKKEWTLPSDFPNSRVIEAFLTPDVRHEHPIEYKLFDVDKVIDFATKAFQFSGEGFSQWKDALKLEYQRRTKPQQSIDDFFKPMHFKYKIKSARLQTSLQNLKQNKLNEGLADVEQAILSNMSIQEESNPTRSPVQKKGLKKRRTDLSETDSDPAEEDPSLKPKKTPKYR